MSAELSKKKLKEKKKEKKLALKKARKQKEDSVKKLVDHESELIVDEHQYQEAFEKIADIDTGGNDTHTAEQDNSYYKQYCIIN